MAICQTKLTVSTKARKQSYYRMRNLFDFLYEFGITHPYHEHDDYQIDIDYKGWKNWANKYTPPDKRGGPVQPVSNKRKNR